MSEPQPLTSVALGASATVAEIKVAPASRARLMEMGLLVGKGGLHANTIRFAPPMCINQADAEFMLGVFDEAFANV